MGPQISADPQNDNLVLVANDDYAVKLFDIRDPRQPACSLGGVADVTHAEHHPTLSNLFISSTSMGEIL